MLLIIMALSGFSRQVFAASKEFNLTLKNHLFYPSTVIIPSNTKVKLVITNLDDTPEEFDSFDLNREKILFPHRKAVIYIGPLKKGHYQFFGEFNPYLAKGTVVVQDLVNACDDGGKNSC